MMLGGLFGRKPKPAPPKLRFYRCAPVNEALDDLYRELTATTGDVVIRLHRYQAGDPVRTDDIAIEISKAATVLRRHRRA